MNVNIVHAPRAQFLIQPRSGELWSGDPYGTDPREWAGMPTVELRAEQRIGLNVQFSGETSMARTVDVIRKAADDLAAATVRHFRMVAEQELGRFVCSIHR